MDASNLDLMIKILQTIQGMGLPVLVGSIAGVVIAIIQLIKVIIVANQK